MSLITDNSIHSLAKPLVDLRLRESYPHDDLGFLQRMHPLRGEPFGKLVYMADSIMQPMRSPGFGMHPHKDVEVISYVVDGDLTHRDSVGNVGIVRDGSFQRISAGTGIEHDESNRTDKPLRMFQIWFEPAQFGVVPNYAVIDSTQRLKPGAFVKVMDRDGSDDALTLNADASIALGRFSPGEPVNVAIAPYRNALLYVVTGSASTDGKLLRQQDHLRIEGAQQIRIDITEKSLLMLIDSAA